MIERCNDAFQVAGLTQLAENANRVSGRPRNVSHVATVATSRAVGLSCSSIRAQ